MTGGPRLKWLTSHINTVTRNARTFAALRVWWRIPGCEVSRLPFIGGAACTIGIRRAHQSLSAQPLDESTHMLTGSLYVPPANPHTQIRCSFYWLYWLGWLIKGLSKTVWQIFMVLIDFRSIWVKNNKTEVSYWCVCVFVYKTLAK